MTELFLDAKALDFELSESRHLLENSGLPRILAEVDRGSFGTTPLNLEILEAVSQALAAALAASRMAALKDAGAYAGFILAEEAADRLAVLGDRPENPEGELPPGQYSDLGAGGALRTLETLVRDCADFARFYSKAEGAKRLRRDTESLRCLLSYFRMISRTLRRLGPEPPAGRLSTPRLRFEGWRAVPTGSEEPHELLDVGFDDIVGNPELIKAGRRLARDVAGFDLKAGKNPKRLRNQVLFVLGTPGCGKTVTAHAIGRYFLDLCEKAGLPGRMRVIRRTDWASSYQNQSASRLLEIFKGEVFNAPGVCGVYWPDIDTAFAARGDSEIRQEEKSNLGTIFGILDGTIGPKNGRWFLICDANSLRMDEATLSRLSQSPLTAKGPETPEDFVRLLKQVKLRGKDAWLPLSEAEWLEVGRRCVKEGLSGRSADSIAGRVLSEIEDFDEPDDYFGKSFEEKQKIIEDLSRPIPAARLQEMIAQHCKFEREAQRKADEEKFLDRVREIRLHLSAQQAAIGTMKNP